MLIYLQIRTRTTVHGACAAGRSAFPSPASTPSSGTSTSTPRTGHSWPHRKASTSSTTSSRRPAQHSQPHKGNTREHAETSLSTFQSTRHAHPNAPQQPGALRTTLSKQTVRKPRPDQRDVTGHNALTFAEVAQAALALVCWLSSVVASLGSRVSSTRSGLPHAHRLASSFHLYLRPRSHDC